MYFEKIQKTLIEQHYQTPPKSSLSHAYLRILIGGLPLGLCLS